MELGTMLGMLPVRLDVMDDPVYANDPDYRVMIAAMRGGYSLPAVPRWGLVEESLRDAFYQIWQTIETNPKQSVGDIVARHMEALAHHLDGILAA
jgi:ABC-type glycerol-3-phosphate transport system substrate-binding protein